MKCAGSGARLRPCHFGTRAITPKRPRLRGWRGLVVACREGDRRLTFARPMLCIGNAGVPVSALALWRPFGTGLRGEGCTRYRRNYRPRASVTQTANAHVSHAMRSGALARCMLAKKRLHQKGGAIGRNLSRTGFEGGGTVARQKWVRVEGGGTTGPGSSKATWEEESCVASTGGNMRLSAPFSNHMSGMAAMHLMQVSLEEL